MTWDDVAQSYANLGWGREGVGIAEIAGIADIARDRKSKINHGDTEKGKDRNTRRSGAIEFAKSSHGP
jgi:hypothetical protein